MIGNFQGTTFPARCSSAWAGGSTIRKDGMERQMTARPARPAQSLLPQSATDSRSFLTPVTNTSACILCRMIGHWVVDGEAPADPRAADDRRTFASQRPRLHFAIELNPDQKNRNVRGMSRRRADHSMGQPRPSSISATGHSPTRTTTTMQRLNRDAFPGAQCPTADPVLARGISARLHRLAAGPLTRAHRLDARRGHSAPIEQRLSPA